jgi:hypothetical protein
MTEDDARYFTLTLDSLRAIGGRAADCAERALPVYAALALELDGGGDPGVGAGEIRRAIESAPAEAREVLLEMPARQPGTSRLDMMLYQLDASIRARRLSRPR